MGSKRWRRNRRLKCGCSGYWFPHRITSGSCEFRADKLAATRCAVRREGGDELQVVADWHWDNPGQPFNEWKEEPMRAYRVVDDDNRRDIYKPTKDEAHAEAKTFNKGVWADLLVQEVEIPTDKDSLLKLLNGDTSPLEVKRAWELTIRGGLKEAA